MLKELRENDEAQYPVNSVHRPGKTDGYTRNAGHPDRRKGGYIARVANVEPYPDTPLHTADEMSQHLHLCYNCGLAGHYWADCTKPLSDSLKLAKERLNRGIREKQENQLNPNGVQVGREPMPPRLCRPRPIRPRPRTAQFLTHSLRVLE